MAKDSLKQDRLLAKQARIKALVAEMLAEEKRLYGCDPRTENIDDIEDAMIRIPWHTIDGVVRLCETAVGG